MHLKKMILSSASIDTLLNPLDLNKPHTFPASGFTELFSFSGRFLPVSTFIPLNIRAANQLRFKGVDLGCAPGSKV